MTYYNTTLLNDAELKQARLESSKGDQKVLDILLQFKNKDMSASLIQLVMVREKNLSINITHTKELNFTKLKHLKRVLGSTDSIKRSLNTLYSKGIIERRESEVEGAWGRKEFTYRIKK